MLCRRASSDALEEYGFAIGEKGFGVDARYGAGGAEERKGNWVRLYLGQHV